MNNAVLMEESDGIDHLKPIELGLFEAHPFLLRRCLQGQHETKIVPGFHDDFPRLGVTIVFVIVDADDVGIARL